MTYYKTNFNQNAEVERELSHFGKFLSSHSLEKSTYNFYISDIRQFLYWKRSINSSLLNVSTKDIISYLEFLSSREVSVNSLNRRLSSLRRYDEFLQSKGLESFMKGIKNTKNNSDETNAKLKKFIEYIRLTQKNQKTVKNYTSDLKQFSFWLKQQGYGEEIGLYEVDQYLAHLSSKKSISSIKRAKSTLYQFLAWQSSLNKINLNYSEDKPVVVKEENRISPVILFVVLLIIISQAYLPFKGSTTNTLSTTQDVQTPYIKETRVVNPELSFKPSNAKSIVVLSEPLETDVDQDVMPLVVDEVDYSMLYSDPDMGSQQISTSGKGIIPPYHNKVEIISPFAQKDSNIQITPTTSTKNKVLYVSKQTDKSFTVAIDETISEQINFVWTIN